MTTLAMVESPHAATALHTHADAGEYLAFRLGGEEYGIDILRVQEIRNFESPTRIASAPAFILGVVNLRGVIVPVLDMRRRMGCESAAFDASTVTIVLNVNSRVVGMVVDSVSDVVQLTTDLIKPAPVLAAAVDARYITGVATLDAHDQRRMLILLDIDTLMASEDMGLQAATH